MSHQAKARKVFDIEIAALRAVCRQLDDSFDAAVNTFCEALRKRGKIVVVGVGKSGIIGHKIAATLTSTGATAVVLHSVDALHGDLGVVNDGDVILVLSYSGETEELLTLLPALKRFSVKVVSFTSERKSTLARFSDVIISVKVPREACPFNLAPTSSSTAMLAMGDALAMAVLEARGANRADFARYHPSGAIGRSLLLSVSDIRRGTTLNPVASEDTVVKAALLVMTRARAGSVSVVNRRGKLVGVFTDGDLRRHMADGDHVLSRQLSEVMTRKPICIRDTSLAIDALRIFNERNIDDLIVVNAKKEPIGLVDSQDLPKFKLM